MPVQLVSIYKMLINTSSSLKIGLFSSPPHFQHSLSPSFQAQISKVQILVKFSYARSAPPPSPARVFPALSGVGAGLRLSRLETAAVEQVELTHAGSTQKWQDVETKSSLSSTSRGQNEINAEIQDYMGNILREGLRRRYVAVRGSRRHRRLSAMLVAPQTLLSHSNMSVLKVSLKYILFNINIYTGMWS